MTGGVTETFGGLLRRYRQAAALSQEALAERAGLSAVTISALERGTRRAPYLGTVEVLATALELSPPERVALVAAARPVGSTPRSPRASDALVPLVGRERELALLERFLADEHSPPGQPSVLLLAGEPGIGKTRLLQAAAQRAIAHGWCVLVGGCQRRGGHEPYAPLPDTLLQYLQAPGATERRAALAGCAWLVRLLPELADDLEALPAWSLPPAQERRMLFTAVARLLTNVAGPAGTLLVLDDLQWAGPDALDLLDALARVSAPLRLVGAYRDTEVQPADPLGLLLADLSQARLVQQQTLSRLSEAEATALLEDLLLDVAERDRGLIERVLQRAEGTPFFLVSYAQSLQQGSVEGVPWDLAQGVRQRLALLPSSAQDVLGVAAMVGRRAPRSLLLSAAGQPEEDVVAGLDAACRAGLLLEEGEDSYLFAHDVIREVVEAEVGAARRAVLHRRIAEALLSSPVGAPAELLAYHFARAGVQDQAARYLELAGDHAAAQGALAAAESHYSDALERLEPLGHSHDAARVLEKLGGIQDRAGRYEAALASLQQAADAYRVVDDLDSLIRTMAGMGRLHALLGTSDTGLALIKAQLDRIDMGSASPSAQALLSYVRGSIFLFTAQYDAALLACESAASLARAAGDNRTLALADGMRVNLLQMLGRLDDALEAGHEVLLLLEETNDGDALFVLRDLAYIYALRGDFALSARWFERAFEMAAQVENLAELSLILAFKGWLSTLSGDGHQAHADLEQSLTVSRQAGQPWYLPLPLIYRARLALIEGDLATATSSALEALTLAERGGEVQGLRIAAGVIAEVDILEGRTQAASTRLTPLFDRLGPRECEVTMLLPTLAWAQLELGQLDIAADTVAQALILARPGNMRLAMVEALRVQALIALRRQQWDEANSSLAEGLELARRMPWPYAAARLLHVAGSLHAARGVTELARSRWTEARDGFRQLGAAADLARVEQHLVALPEPPRHGSGIATDARRFDE